MGKVFNMVGGGGGAGSPDLPIGSRINVTSDIGATIDITKGSLHYQKTVNGNNLPSEYQEIEYIQGTGTQYINTSYNPLNGDVFEVEFYPTSTTTSTLFGVKSNGSNNNGRFFVNDDVANTKFNCVYNSDFLENVYSISRNNKHKAILSSGNLNIDGTEFTFSTTFSGNATRPLFIFGHNNVGSLYYGFIGRIYSFKIKNGTTSVRNYVPCYRVGDSVIGMYETVSGTFFANAGSGTFGKGADVTQGTVTFVVSYSGTWSLSASKSGEETITSTVSVLADDTDYYKSMSWRVPSIYQEVEYLESSGTQYINTAVTQKPNLIWELDLQFMTTATQTHGCLNYVSSSSSSRLDIGRNIYNNWVLNIGSSGSKSGADLLRHYIKMDSVNLHSYIDGVVVASTSYTALTTNSTPIYLFARYSSIDGVIDKTSCRVYGSRIYDNTTLLRDFVPCYRKSDSVAGLWDAVNKVFYENNGTGTFIVGGDVP